MNVRVLLLISAGIGVCNPALVQPVIEKHVEIIESLAESAEVSEDGKADYESLLEELEYLYEHPLNLNTATLYELQKTVFPDGFPDSKPAGLQKCEWCFA
ncbi:MAG: hypothetical protein JXA61_02545 [Bacteroidales bacterium]|nr:hypothetical protein [Bacteroidales bacterium]